MLKDHILEVIAPVNEASPYADDFDDLNDEGSLNSCTSSIQPTECNLIDKERTIQAV